VKKKMDLEMIRTRMSQIDGLEEENRKAKELIKDQLENDETYQESLLKAKEILKEKKRLKDTILAESRDIIEDVKANNEEISTLKEILSTELMEYHSEKKTDEIKDDKGEVRKFKIIVRLEPKKTYDKRDYDGKYTKELNN
jgi:hypothetical protein